MRLELRMVTSEKKPKILCAFFLGKSLLLRAAPVRETKETKGGINEGKQANTIQTRKKKISTYQKMT